MANKRKFLDKSSELFDILYDWLYVCEDNRSLLTDKEYRDFIGTGMKLANTINSVSKRIGTKRDSLGRMGSLYNIISHETAYFLGQVEIHKDKPYDFIDYYLDDNSYDITFGYNEETNEWYIEKEDIQDDKYLIDKEGKGWNNFIAEIVKHAREFGLKSSVNDIAKLARI